MKSPKKFITISKYSLMLLFSVLAFGSCGLKEFVADLVNIEYKRSFNKTKSTTSNCIDGKHTSSCIAISKQTKKNTPKLFKTISSNKWVNINYVLTYAYLYSSNSPPKYIMFKRLKIALS